MKKVLITSFFVMLIGGLLVLRPVPIVTEDEAVVEVGVVDDVYANEDRDLVFVLQNGDRTFYINRGVDEGLDAVLLKEKLKGHKVIFKYPEYWTPLDWNNRIRHVSKIEFNGEVIFNELKTSARHTDADE